MCEEIHSRMSPSCEDILGVVDLPIEIPQSDRSSVLNEYVDRKRQLHENIFTDMRFEIECMNKTTDKKIKQSLDLVKEEIAFIRNELDHPNIRDIQSTDQWLAFSGEQQTRKLRIASLINEYYLEVSSYEQNRAENLKKMLTKYEEMAVTLRFCSPGGTAKRFEDVALGLNISMLNNVRTQEDIKVQLQVEGQKILDDNEQYLKNKAAHLAKHHAQNLWEKIRNKQNQRLVVDTMFNLTQENLMARTEFPQATFHLVMGLSEFAEILKFPTDFDIGGGFWESWVGILNTSIESLDSLCKRVKVLLKTAITSLLEQFDNKIDSLARTFYPNLEEVIPESGNAIGKMSNQIQILKDQRGEELKRITSNWQEMIYALSIKIDQSKAFVSDLTSIWTNHKNRMNKLQTDLESELENQKKLLIKEELTMNSKTKNLIKAVREAKDLQKLNNSCKILENAFYDLKGKIEHNYDIQLETLEAVRMSHIEPLVEMKVSEIKEFLLVKYPKSQWLDETVSVSLKNCGSELDNQVEMCNTYMKSVDNRTLGMYEMLERYLPICGYAVKEESEDWLYIVIQDLTTSFQSHLDEIRDNHETTLLDLKRTRFAELQIHSDRLLSHSCGVKSVLTKLTQHYDQIKLYQKSQLADFNVKLKSMLTDKSAFELSKQIQGASLELQHEWLSLCKSMEDMISQAKTNCLNEIDSLNNSNKSFSQNAKGFKSGGNYSPEELNILNKEVKQLQKLISNHRKSLMNSYNSLTKAMSSSVYDATTKELKSKHSQLKLEEDLASLLKIVRFRLRSDANRLRALGKIMEQTIAHIRSAERAEEGIIDHINSIAQSILNLLMLPSELIPLECFRNKTESNTSLKMTSKKSKPDTVSNPTKLFEKITGDIPTESNCYIANTKYYLLNKFADLAKYVQEVLVVESPPKSKNAKGKKAKSIFLREDEAAVKKIELLKSTLLHYNKDCEVVWIQEAQNYLEQIHDLRDAFNCLVKQQFSNVHKTYMNGMDVLEKWYKEVVAEKLKETEVNINKIHKTLVLPLAHPTHQYKLNELFKEALNNCETHNKDFRELMNIYKRELQGKHDKYVEQIKSIKEELSNMQSIVFNDGLLNVNLEDISTIPFRNSIQSFNETECKVDQNDPPIYPLSIWTDFESPAVTPVSSRGSSNNVSLKADPKVVEEVSIVKLATENLKDSAEQIQRLYDDARYGLNIFEKSTKRWITSFEYDIKQAKNIHINICA